MRTLAHCRTHGLTLRTHCPACGSAPPAPICQAFNAWTVDELERAGAIACAKCGRAGLPVAVVGIWWAKPIDLEVWRGDYGSVRRGLQGVSD